MAFLVKVKHIHSGKTISLTRFKHYQQAYDFYMALNKTIFFEPCHVKLMNSEYSVISAFESPSPDSIMNL